MRRLGHSLFVLAFSFCFVAFGPQFANAESDLLREVGKLADTLTSSTSGEVVAVEGDIIYLNLCEKDSIHEGSDFEVVRPGEVIMVGNKAIHKEKPIGEIQVDKVRKDYSTAKATTSYARIEKGDKVYQKGGKVSRIALTEFPYGSGFNNLTKNIYESLYVSFAQKGLQVVERSQLDKVLQEQKISYSGMIDISTAKKLGQLLGTEAVLLGTVSDMGNDIVIRSRLVDAGKGLVLDAAQVNVTKTPEILAMIKNGSRGPKGPQPPPNGPPDSTKDLPTYENDFLKVEAVSLTKQADGLELILRYLNKTKEPLRLQLRDPKEDTYLVDDQGNRHSFKESETSIWPRHTIFPPGVPTNIRFVLRSRENSRAIYIFSSKHNARDTFFVVIKDIRMH